VHLKGLTKLTCLNLDNTKVTDAGLVHLKHLAVHLKRLADLQELYLVDTQVTDAGIAELQQVLPNCKIKKPNGEIHK